MVCPKCGSGKMIVNESRHLPDGTIRRRRICRECKHRFTSYEVIANEIKDNNQDIREELKKKVLIKVQEAFEEPLTEMEIRSLAKMNKWHAY